MNQTTPRVMILIDADNVTADVIEQALPLVMQRHGAIHVRRAYCTAELALKHLKLFKAHSIRPIVNVSTGKNSTDIALAVDAMDLVVAERPDLVVIVSSDSDFAPLVIRLREKGCRVEGIGQEGKTGEDSKPVYDAFIDIPHRKGRAAPAKAAPAKRAARGTGRLAPAKSAPAPEPEPELVFPPVEPPVARAPARKRAARSSASAAAAAPVAVAAPEPKAVTAAPAPVAQAEAAAAPVPRKRAAKATARSSKAATAPAAASPIQAPAPAPLEAPVPAAVPAAARRERQPRAQPRLAQPMPPAQPQAPATQARRPRAAPPRAPAAPSLPEEVVRILAALPELQSGARLQLNLAKERLCNAGLLARSAPSTKLFRKHPRLFVLTPEAAPNKVQFLRPMAQ